MIQYYMVRVKTEEVTQRERCERILVPLRWIAKLKEIQFVGRISWPDDRITARSTNTIVHMDTVCSPNIRLWAGQHWCKGPWYSDTHVIVSGLMWCSIPARQPPPPPIFGEGIWWSNPSQNPRPLQRACKGQTDESVKSFGGQGPQIMTNPFP